jgi:hypothetical protein
MSPVSVDFVLTCRWLDLCSLLGQCSWSWRSTLYCGARGRKQQIPPPRHCILAYKLLCRFLAYVLLHFLWGGTISPFVRCTTACYFFVLHSLSFCVSCFGVVIVIRLPDRRRALRDTGCRHIASEIGRQCIPLHLWYLLESIYIYNISWDCNTLFVSKWFFCRDGKEFCVRTILEMITVITTCDLWLIRRVHVGLKLLSFLEGFVSLI